MSIQVRYFASIREALGTGEVVPLPADATLAGLRDQLISSSTTHARVLARGRALRCALNQQIGDEAQAIADGDEVAFFPPVTGG